MNREIKFRGRVKHSNEWKYGSLLSYADGECNIITETGHRIDTWNVDPTTVGQYTGLKDKNGKEIYEGDIIGIPEDVDFLPETVIFKEGCFMAQDDYTAIAMNSIDTEYRTIIGNIHNLTTQFETL